MSRLSDLYTEHGQSPWLDNLRRGWIASGQIERLIERGIRGITSNPSIFQKSITEDQAYDWQFGDLVRSGTSVQSCYWQMVISDISEASRVLMPVHDDSDGLDGFVSVEVAPTIARDTEATTTAAIELHRMIDRPNVHVKIPATIEGVESIRSVIAGGHSVNVTLIFSLERYRQVIEAYIAGLEACPGDLSQVSSVASFFISRVDTEVDRRLEGVGTEEAGQLMGKAAVTQGRLAYRLAQEMFSGPRWEALAARGARPQRPLWASTSTKNPAYPDTLYVDELIGPGTVNTLPDATIEAFDDHGTLARTVDADPELDDQTWARLEKLVDLADVSSVLESEGLAAFEKSFDELLEALSVKAAELQR